jgi:Flp pilus assembly protein TadD
VVVAVATSAGCAAREPTFSSRFIAHGTPAVDLGGGEPAAIVRAVASRRSPPTPAPLRAVSARHSSNLSTLEATSPPLQRALLALAVDPTPARYLDVAAAYRAAGVRDRAFDYLVEGLLHAPGDAALHDGLARAWRDWGFADRGLAAAHRAVHYAPRAPEPRNTLGTVLWALGQRAEARRAFQEAVTLDARAWYAWRNLCHAAMSEGRTQEATALCQRATAARKSAGAAQ